MKKFGVLTVVLALSALVLAGCGDSKSEGGAKSVDVKALGGDLAGKITYQDDLSETDLDTLSMFMDLSGVDVKSASIYESSGATAEEIVVLECGTPADAAKAADVFKTRVADQKDSFQDYVPEELDKLGKAVIATSGNYAVLSVSDDADTAKSVISDYLK